MDNTSPARSPDSQQSRKQSRGTPSPLGKNNLDPNLKSCFSDDEGKYEEDERDKNIEQLAEEHDYFKSSRQELFECMSAKMNGPSSARKSKKQLQTSLENIKESYSTTTKEAKSASYTSPNVPQQKDNSAGGLGNSPRSERSPGVFSPVDVPGDKKNPYLVEEENEESVQMDEIKLEPGTLQAIPEIRFEDSLHSQEKASTGELPVIQGFLQKKSPGLFGLWQKRYFVLKNKKLYYYPNENKEVKSGVVDFDLVSVKLERGSKKTELKIIPIGGSRVFRLRTQAEEDREKWFSAIEKHVQASKGAIISLSKTAGLKQFWKNDRISMNMFIDQVESGDILLFKTHSIISKIQRSVTRSEFDHVALIVKYGPATNQIFLFEAMREGVGLCRWSTFMDKGWYKLYEKIIYRKLIIPRTSKMQTEVDKFVKTNVGKKWRITPNKLLRKKSSANNSEDKTFFCSELVAALYKKLGFLPLDISAAHYYPGTFAAEKKLMLLDAAKLSQEYLIDFNL